MVKINFKGKLMKVGNSYMVIVPMHFIRSGMLWTNDDTYYISVNTEYRGNQDES